MAFTQRVSLKMTYFQILYAKLPILLVWPADLETFCLIVLAFNQSIFHWIQSFQHFFWYYIENLQLFNRSQLFLTHFKPLISFCTPGKHRKISGCLMFSGGTFFYLGFLSRTFTIQMTAGEGWGYFFKSSPPLSPASQTLRRQPGDYCKEFNSSHS